MPYHIYSIVTVRSVLGRIILLASLLVLCSEIDLFANDPDVEYSKTIEFNIEHNDDSYRLSAFTTVTQKCLSERSTTMHTIPVTEQFYDPVSNLRARLRDDWLEKSAFSFIVNPGEDVFLSDFKLHTIRLPRDIQVGDEVYYEYRKDYKELAFIPLIRIPNMEYVKDYRVAFKHPEDVSVSFDFFMPHGTVPYTVEHPEAGNTVLTFRDLHQQKSLANFPFNDELAVVQISLLQGGKPLNPTTVRDFTTWYQKLFPQDPKLAPAFDTLLSGELAQAKNAQQKLRVIHDYVRTHIRYIADEHAINAFVPRDPSKVLSQGYGDCKDRAYLVRTLARRQGLNVSMALISTSPRPVFDGTHVTQFNHVICAFEDGGKTVFFDPTGKYCEFGNLPEGDVGAQVLVIDPANPRLTAVPPPNDTRSVDVSITATIAEPKKGKARIVLRNDFFQNAVEAREKNTGLELENILSDLVTSQFQKISFDYFEFDSQQEDAITFTAVADISDFIITSPTRKYLPQMPFRLIDPTVLERANDTLAIFNPHRIRVGMSLDLDAPGFQPKPATLAFGDGKTAVFNATMGEGTENRIRIEYDMAQHDKQMNGERRDHYLEFCRSFLKSKKEMFVLNKQ